MDLRSVKDIIRFAIKKSYRELLINSVEDNKIKSINTLSAKDTRKHILIIRRSAKAVGTFSDYIVFLRAIELALSLNYIPVIDRFTVGNNFLSAVENTNTWELFFEQPFLIGLEDIDYDSMQVSTFNCGSGMFPVSLLQCSDLNIIGYWRSIAKQYIRFNDDIQHRIDNVFNNSIIGKECLGISVREGYSYAAKKKIATMREHPVQVETAELIEIAKRKMKEWCLDFIFFSCQAKETVELFKKEFGNKAICVDRERPRYNDIIEWRSAINHDCEKVIQIEKDYITEMALLSKCNSLICSPNSGSDAAFLMSSGYRHTMCIDRGTYVF